MSHAVRNCTKICGIEFHGIPEMEKRPDDYEKNPELKYKYRSREFWRRGYTVDTAGKNKENRNANSPPAGKKPDKGETINDGEFLMNPSVGGK